MSKTPFDYIKTINEKNEYIFDEEDAKDYNSHVVNTGLSFFSDTIFLVNEANKYNLNGKMHYDFLYYSIEKRKRYSKWFKKSNKEEHLENVMEYFGVNISKAKDLIKALSDDNLNTIKQKLQKGGMQNDR